MQRNGHRRVTGATDVIALVQSTRCVAPDESGRESPFNGAALGDNVGSSIHVGFAVVLFSSFGKAAIPSHKPEPPQLQSPLECEGFRLGTAFHLILIHKMPNCPTCATWELCGKQAGVKTRQRICR